ncbi:MAG: PilZ domain-containing protein [Desulfobacterales bacterium]|nr:PilZ domain-containing protein [Desulfobacterales bacterium]
MNNKSDRRDFDRFPIEFEIEVAAQDSEGRKYSEKTVLSNISGGGAQFITQQAGKYFTGQQLEMTVFLTGTDIVKARMKGKATVVRIDPSSNSGIGEKTRGAGIAVKFDASLYFERADVKTQGNHKECPGNL